MDLVIRDRRDADIPALVDLLSRQQQETRYPHTWPFPRPLQEFIKRPSELRAWVAELGGELAGHVAVTSVGDDPLGRAWARAHNAPIRELRCVSVFFADIRHSGQGIGSRLLQHATEHALTDGYPVLDVVAAHEGPTNLYLRRGWKLIATTPAPWAPDTELPIHLMILPRPALSGAGHRPPQRQPRPSA